jgi:two-component system, response regulator, stage 0 sporulation protein F
MPKILVIDDEADMRFAVRMLLERSGHTVIEAENGDAALAKLEGESPDLVLLDMRLPGMDGIQILQRIREKRKDIPIIMVTGYGNVELAEQALQLGADHYLSKPFHNKELIEVIEQILQKHGYLPTTAPEAPAEDAAPQEATEAAAVEIESEGGRFWRRLLGFSTVLAVGLCLWLNLPRSNYPVPYTNPASIVFIDGKVWIADWFSQAIYIHDLRKRELPLKKTYYLPEVHLTGMAVLDNAVYTADSWAHVLRKHRRDDHLSVELTVPSPGPSPCSLFWDGRYLWSCDLSTGKIYQHQADDRLTVVASYASPGKAPVGFYKDDRYAWSMDAKTRKIYERRLDGQLSVLATYRLPEWEEGSASLASFTWHGKDLWFTRTGQGFICRRAKSRLVGVK